MWNTGLDEWQSEIKIAERNTNDLIYVGDTTLMAESEEELKRSFLWVNEESEKAGLKLNIQTTEVMASGPISSWQMEGAKVTDFIFLSFKITEDGDCSHEIMHQGKMGGEG